MAPIQLVYAMHYIVEVDDFGMLTYLSAVNLSVELQYLDFLSPNSRKKATSVYQQTFIHNKRLKKQTFSIL